MSLLAPEKVQFRYRLEGYDEDWVQGGTRRSASYTNLPPGRYTFRVAASNNDVRALVRAHLGGEEPPDVPLTRGWRAEHLLPRLLAVLRGDVLVRVANLKSPAPLDYADAPPPTV